MASLKIPYLVFRDGRPRWVPGKHLRAQGFKGLDLKDAAGGWLSPLDAMARAKELNAAIAASKALSEDAPLPKLPKGDRNVAALIDRYRRCAAFTETAIKTQRSYAYHMGLIDELFGDLPVEKVSLEMIEDFYGDLQKDKGDATANAVIRTGKLLWNYAIKHEWLLVNRWTKLDVKALNGRLVVFTADEIRLLIATAENLGWASQAHAILLGLFTGQRQSDVLSLTEIACEGGFIKIKQKKTGAYVRIPILPQLQTRFFDVVKRDNGNVTALPSRPILICETTGEGWKPDYFRHVFAKIREEAGKTMPTVLDKRWADLRDTTVTWLAIARSTIPEIASITGHSLKTVTEIIDKHYLVRDDALSASAAQKLEHFAGQSFGQSFGKTGLR